MARDSKGKGRRVEPDDEDEYEEQPVNTQGSAMDVDGEEEEEQAQGQTGAAHEYNPEQDVDEKRKIRKDYRDLTTALNDNRARDPDGITAGSLRNGLQRINELFHKVQTPAEAVLDSNYLMITGEIALQQARKLKVGGDYFDTDDFLLRLKTVITGGGAGRANAAGGTPRRSQQSNRRRDSSDDEDELEAPAQDVAIGWNKIGYLATKHTMRVPPIDFMLGPLAIPAKKKVVREKKAKEKAAPAKLVQPKTMEREDIEIDEQETSRLVRYVASVLEEAGGAEGMNLLEFIINPHDFGQSVENFFYLSFLVKENRACIELNGHEPTVYACEPMDGDERQENQLATKQILLEFDHEMWESAIKAYDIKEPTIPHRQKKARDAGKWLG